MSVRYADTCGDTGGPSDREEKDLFRADYHERAVVDGFFSRGSIPAKRRDYRYWQEPVREERNTSDGMRTRTESRGKACVRQSFSFKIQYHGTVCACPVFGMSSQYTEHETQGMGKRVCQWEDFFF